MKNSIEIAQSAIMKPIWEIASKLDIKQDEIELYGDYKCKIRDTLWQRISSNKDGKLVLVTAMTPTPSGEGKTTTTVGLGQAMNLIGRKTIIALREPSLGPVFGFKGGAAGGGMSQVVPMEDINLHFTGDFHAISAAHSLISAAIDNHIYQGNRLDIDVGRIMWKRAADVNDRALRNIVIGLGGRLSGVPREDGFTITAASEIMAVLCLSTNLMDLKNRISEIIVAYSRKDLPVRVRDLNIQGAAALLLRDALKPNLVQTLENTPALIHGGPFANIAHGCSSLIATRYGLKLADYLITEAGFGSDLGAEKFFDIKCRIGGLKPSAAVIVATLRALKYNGGLSDGDLSAEDSVSLKKGSENLLKHIENIKAFGIPAIVAVNRFSTDTENEFGLLKEICHSAGVDCVASNVWSEGGKGGLELAERLCSLIENGASDFRFLYPSNIKITEKIDAIIRKMYGGKSAEYSPTAIKAIARLENAGLGDLPVCMAKTQYSLSDNPGLKGRPGGFTVGIRDVRPSAGAGFIVAYAGDILTMPGLPSKPAAESMDIDSEGVITGLF
ncbi:MAG: formate--tetrahydrofolate ligase [Eubacteriales bacterium]|nr:formate--tetrahydrofolate ligase [Eubacteriales bacterium]